MKVNLKRHGNITLNTGDVIVTETNVVFMVCKYDTKFTLVNLHDGKVLNLCDSLLDLQAKSLVSTDVVYKNDEIELRKV